MLVCSSFVLRYISVSSDAGYLVSEGVKPCIYFTRWVPVTHCFPHIYGIIRNGVFRSANTIYFSELFPPLE